MKKTFYVLLGTAFLLSCQELPEFSSANDIPVPTNGTVVKSDMEEGGKRQKREAWIQLLHQAAPGVEWRKIESERAWQKHLGHMGERRLQGRTPDEISIANGKIVGEWEEKGSSNLAGSVVATAFDAAADEIYVVGAGGCLFKGARSGDDWQVVNQDLRFGGDLLSFVEHNGGQRLIGIVDRAPAWSDDLGYTWVPSQNWINYTDNWGSIYHPVIEGASGHIIALAKTSYWSNLSVYVSDNGGTSFKHIRDLGSHDTGKYDLCREKNSGKVWLVDKVNPDNIDFYSYDPASSSFELSSVSRDHGFGEEGVANLEAVRVNDSTSWFYALYNRRVLCFSEDLGQSWTCRDTLDENAWGVGMFVSPSDPELVLAGAVQCYRSDDGGNSIRMINRWQDYYGDVANKLHADMMYFNEFESDQNESFITISNHGGLNLSYDKGLTTPSISQLGLNVSQYYSVRTDPFYRDYIYAGSQDQGFQRGMDDQEGAVRFDQIISGDYGHIVFSSGGRNMWTVYPGGWVIYYDDPRNQRGPRFSFSLDSKDETVWIPPLAEIPNSAKDDILLAGGSIYGGEGSHLIHLEATAGGIMSSQYDFDFKAASGGGTISAIHVSPVSPDRIYVATTNGNFFYSNDKGLSWDKALMSVPGGHYLYGASIVSSSFDESVVFMGGSGYSNAPVVWSRNGGRVFTPFSEGLPSTTVFGLALDPEEQMLFAATEAGPYVCILEERKWYPMAEGIAPNQTYWSVEYLYPERIARFGTYGRGIWDFQVSNINTGVEGTAVQKSSWDLFPNPVRDHFRIRANDDLRIEKVVMVDMNGREVRTWDHSGGTRPFRVEGVPMGIYQVGIKAEGQILWKKIAVQ